MDDQSKTEKHHIAPEEMSRLFARSSCSRCGDTVAFPGTTRCGNCWELETRIPKHPDIAAQILRECGYTVTASVYRGVPHE